MTDPRPWVGFSMIRGVGPATIRKLLQRFGDLAAAWRADAQALRNAGLDGKTAQAILVSRGQLPLDQVMAELERRGIKVLTWDDDAYPKRLREIDYPPPVLYVKGALLPEDEWSVAVVGTRRASAYGREATHRIVGGLARSGVTIVSGLALGIDSEAHRAALEAGGRTIAVLGSGLDVLYPAENARLAMAIAERGAVVSEYPLGRKPEATNFPARNRIISGLSLGVVVVEAGETSGALITANWAAEQSREVFAVPGSILSSGSAGTHRLIQEGAKLTTSAEDVLEELNLTMVPQQLELKQLLPENAEEATLMRLLSGEPVHIDELSRGSGLPIATVSSTLALMELKGMVRQIGGMHFVLARS